MVDDGREMITESEALLSWGELSEDWVTWCQHRTLLASSGAVVDTGRYHCHRRYNNLTTDSATCRVLLSRYQTIETHFSCLLLVHLSQDIVQFHNTKILISSHRVKGWDYVVAACALSAVISPRHQNCLYNCLIISLTHLCSALLLSSRVQCYSQSHFKLTMLAHLSLGCVSLW